MEALQEIEVSVCKGQNETVVAESENMKFVLVEEGAAEAKKRKLILADGLNFSSPYHVDMVPPHTVLIGAGKIDVQSQSKSIRINWGSRSCLYKFEYDCPEDPAQREKLRKEISDRVRIWIQKVLSNKEL